ncbi:MAG: DNA polymerase III subunit alpha, partial [Arcicella sp.]|nr:DNA polymerase III subunit alpha [Arcicella sp.]
KQNHGVEIDIDNIPLDDKKTYELYQRGETNATFQFESGGMQKHLLDLKPDQFSDLIAMNALYRPGPIAYIPNFIARKHGREEISYDLPIMEEYLSDTYGITVYQEQVMLLSQSIAGFSKGDADVLRKAMGKKDRYTLDKMKSKFVEGAKAKGHPEDKLNKVWTDWEAFAQYAFNKSHSTCYALVAYQTGYLKAHYPSEYMAAVMSNSLGQIEKITFFMEECRRMGLPVLGPDINESYRSFAVNKKGEIRFGLAAIKGTGDAAVDSIIDERDKNGPYKSIFDFVKRVSLRTVNKKTIESLAYGGGFDCFEEAQGLHRAIYFEDSEGSNFIEKLIRFANKAVEDANSAQGSLFGAMDGGGGAIATPRIPQIEKWGQMEKLKFEKEVVGIYISGHPLDEYRLELDSFCSCTLDRLMEPIFRGKEIAVGGIVTKSLERFSKNGNPFMLFTLEDYNGSYEFALFGEDFVNLSKYIAPDRFLYIKGVIKSKWGRPDEWEFKPMSVRLLSEIRNQFSKELRITIGLQMINSQTINHLNTLISKHQGTCNLSVLVYDAEEKVEVTMMSRKNKISPSNEFLEELKAMNGVIYKLN